MEQHGLVKNFACEECEKQFHLHWRLQKHVLIHSPDSEAHFCQYFNNNKKCPFQNVGCMFKHEKSGKCRFLNCTWKLCEFEHCEVQNNLNSDIETVEDPSEEDQVRCKYCSCTFLNEEELNYHVTTDHPLELNFELAFSKTDSWRTQWCVISPLRLG